MKKVLEILNTKEEIVTTCFYCKDLITMDEESSKEAKKEFEGLFPCEKLSDECIIICDDCFKEGLEHRIKNN